MSFVAVYFIGIFSKEMLHNSSTQWSEEVTKPPKSSEHIRSFWVYFEQKSVFKHFLCMNNTLKADSKVKKDAQK